MCASTAPATHAQQQRHLSTVIRTGSTRPAVSQQEAAGNAKRARWAETRAEARARRARHEFACCLQHQSRSQRGVDRTQAQRLRGPARSDCEARLADPSLTPHERAALQDVRPRQSRQRRDKYTAAIKMPGAITVRHAGHQPQRIEALAGRHRRVPRQPRQNQIPAVHPVWLSTARGEECSGDFMCSVWLSDARDGNEFLRSMRTTTSHSDSRGPSWA